MDVVSGDPVDGLCGECPGLSFQGAGVEKKADPKCQKNDRAMIATAMRATRTEFFSCLFFFSEISGSNSDMTLLGKVL